MAAKFILLALIVFSNLPPSALAATRENWKGEWERLVTSGKREGKVVIYAAGSGISKEHLGAFKERFETAFPGIRVDYTGGQSGEMVARLMAERRAGKFIPDIFLGNGTNQGLRDRTLFQPLKQSFVLPEILDTSRWFGQRFWFYDKEEQYNFIYSLAPVTIIAVNTNLVKAGELTSYKELLDPKWRGKIVSYDLRAGGTGNANINFFYLNPELGPGFLTRLFGETELVLSRSQQQMIDWLGRGKFAILLFPRKFDIDRARGQGLPVDLVNPFSMKEGYALTAGSRGVQLLNPAPHPNAARVYINWFLSVEGQKGVEEMLGYPSVRQDTPTKGSIRDFVVPREATNYFVVSLGKYDYLDEDIGKLLKDLGKSR